MGHAVYGHFFHKTIDVDVKKRNKTCGFSQVIVLHIFLKIYLRLVR